MLDLLKLIQIPGFENQSTSSGNKRYGDVVMVPKQSQPYFLAMYRLVDTELTVVTIDIPGILKPVPVVRRYQLADPNCIDEAKKFILEQYRRKRDDE